MFKFSKIECNLFNFEILKVMLSKDFAYNCKID